VSNIALVALILYARLELMGICLQLNLYQLDEAMPISFRSLSHILVFPMGEFGVNLVVVIE
jgi:hypothetical protein